MGDDVTVVPIFTSQRFGPTRVPIGRGVGGILHDSLLFCEEIATIADEFIETGPLGGRVPDVLLQRVIRGVRRAMGDVTL